VRQPPCTFFTPAPVRRAQALSWITRTQRIALETLPRNSASNDRAPALSRANPNILHTQCPASACAAHRERGPLQVEGSSGLDRLVQERARNSRRARHVVEQRLNRYGRGESVLDLTAPEDSRVSHRAPRRETGRLRFREAATRPFAHGFVAATTSSPVAGSAQAIRYLFRTSAAMQPLPAPGHCLPVNRGPVVPTLRTPLDAGLAGVTLAPPRVTMYPPSSRVVLENAVFGVWPTR